MNNDTEQHSVKNAILQKIQSGDVHMRSGAYLMLRIAALVAVVLLALFVSIAILNFIIFSARVSGHNSLLGFGPRGILIFLTLFPWALLVLDIVLVEIAQWLIRQFRMGYRVPVLYLAGVLLVSTFLIGLALDRATPLNDRLLERADRGELPPPLGELFEGARRPRPPHGGLCRCTIISINGNTIVAYNADFATSSELSIELPEGTDADSLNLRVGETVFIAGDRDHDHIKAFGVSTDPPLPRPLH